MSWTLLSRKDCHLCDQMRAVLDSEGDDLGVRYSLRDIDQHPELVERFDEVVPVLLRDGKPVAKLKLTPGSLRRLVRRSRHD